MEVTAEEKAARASRFADATVPDVVRTFAHKDFDRAKMVISDASARLRSLLLRKLAAGESISEAQAAAAKSHGIDVSELERKAQSAPVSAPALYVEAGIVPRKQKSAKRRAASKSKEGVTAPAAEEHAVAGETRKSRRLSLSAAAAAAASAPAAPAPVASSAAAARTRTKSPAEAPPTKAPSRRLGSRSPGPAAAPAAPEAAAGSSPAAAAPKAAMPGGPKASATLQQAHAALSRIARLEAALAAGEALTDGQRARIAARPAWEAVAAQRGRGDA